MKNEKIVKMFKEINLILPMINRNKFLSMELFKITN